MSAHLVQALSERGLWNEDIRTQIFEGRGKLRSSGSSIVSVANAVFLSGSIQDIVAIPRDIKDLFKTVWDISQKSVIDMAADRAPFICQSQSMSLYLRSPSSEQLVSTLSRRY